MATSEIRSDLKNVLALLLEYPRGLRVLAGEIPPPTPGELSSFGVREKTVMRKLMGRRRTAEGVLIDAVISGAVECAGGWTNIVKTSRRWVHDHPGEWKAVVDYHVFVRPVRRGGVNGDVLGRVARRHGLSADGLGRLADGFPGELADAVIGGLEG
jgi:hypothetical protein